MGNPRISALKEAEMGSSAGFPQMLVSESYGKAHWASTLVPQLPVVEGSLRQLVWFIFRVDLWAAGLGEAHLSSPFYNTAGGLVLPQGWLMLTLILPVK